MVRTSVVQLIFFIALVSASAMAVGTVVTGTGLYSQAVDDASDREATAITTEISIVNDADADANYDGETATLYVKNVGGETIDPDTAEVLVDGEYAPVRSSRVIGGDYWREGRVAELEVEKELIPDSHRITVQVDGGWDVLEFEYRIAFWLDPENQTDDALTYNETDGLYEVNASTTSFDVTMGTDPVQEDEDVTYSVNDSSVMSFEDDADESTGVTDASGQDATTLYLQDAGDGDVVEITLDVGWDTDTVRVRVVDE